MQNGVEHTWFNKIEERVAQIDSIFQSFYKKFENYPS